MLTHPSASEVLISSSQGPYSPGQCLVVIFVRKLMFASERNQTQTKLKVANQTNKPRREGEFIDSLNRERFKLSCIQPRVMGSGVSLHTLALLASVMTAC